MIISFIVMIAGFVALVKGADWFVEGAATIANKWGVPHIVIGLTIVAMGTSLPEAAVSITAAINGNAGISVGNVVGSNIMNILIVLGITALISTMAIEESTSKVEIPFLAAITVMMGVFGYTGNQITRVEGIVFGIAFLLYLLYVAVLTKNGGGVDENEDDFIHSDFSMITCVGLLLVGGVLTVLGSKLIVSGATSIAEAIGISDRIIGLTIVAFGTSLPELVTCVTAAKKGSAGIAIGNIVGSNIFNILFVLGITAIICPVPFESKFIFDTIIALVSVIILWLGALKNKSVGRAMGIIMLTGYVAYTVAQIYAM